MDGKENNLVKLTLIYIAGNFASKLISLLLIFVVTFFLTKEAVGEFDLIIVAITLLNPLISLQISDAIFRWIINNRDFGNISRVLTNAFTIICINLFIFSVVYVGIIFFINFENKLLVYILLILSVLFPIFQAIARSLGKSIDFTISGMLFSIVYFVAAIINLKFLNLKVEGLLIAYSAGNIFAILYLLIRVNPFKYFLKNNFDIFFTKQLVKYSLPLIPNTLSWWTIAAANRYLILGFLGISANGIFAISFKIPTILLTITNIFYLAWQEKAIQTFDKIDRDTYYTQVLDKYVRLLLSSVILLIAFNKLILTYIVDKSFFEAWKYTPILLLAVVFQTLSSFYGTGYLSAKDTKNAFATSVYGGLTTLGTSILFIPNFGLYGASFAILLGYLIMFIARLIQTKKYFSIIFPSKIFFILLIIIFFTTIFSISDNNLINVINIFLSIIFSLIFNRSFIVKFLKLVKNKIFK